MTETKIEMNDSTPINMRFKQRIIGRFRFGRELKVSPKTNAFFNKPGYEIKYFVDSVSVTIGIGKDHTAELTMTLDAFHAFKANEKVEVTTTKEFEKTFGK